MIVDLPHPFLDESDAALYMRANYKFGTPITLSVLRNGNAGPDYIKVGKAIVYTRELIDAWVMKNLRRVETIG